MKALHSVTEVSYVIIRLLALFKNSIQLLFFTFIINHRYQRNLCHFTLMLMILWQLPCWQGSRLVPWKHHKWEGEWARPESHCPHLPAGSTQTSYITPNSSHEILGESSVMICQILSTAFPTYFISPYSTQSDTVVGYLVPDSSLCGWSLRSTVSTLSFFSDNFSHWAI